MKSRVKKIIIEILLLGSAASAIGGIVSGVILLWIKSPETITVRVDSANRSTAITTAKPETTHVTTIPATINTTLPTTSTTTTIYPPVTTQPELEKPLRSVTELPTSVPKTAPKPSPGEEETPPKEQTLSNTPIKHLFRIDHDN